LELLGRLCGDQWSDFNSHDPGITILEQLCYALTELAWRCQWPIADLLAGAAGDWQPAAAAILGGDPVTRDDLLAPARALGCQAVVLEGLDQPDLPLYFRPTSVASASPVAGAPAAPPVAGDLELDASLLASLSTTPPQPVAPRGVWRVAVPLGPGAGGQGPTSHNAFTTLACSAVISASTPSPPSTWWCRRSWSWPQPRFRQACRLACGPASMP
jgi:hypothetical protein